MRFRAVLRGLGLLALEIGALLILHRTQLPTVDWSQFGEWVEGTPPEDAVIGAVRSLALVGTYYLIATTALIIISTVVRAPVLIRGVRLVSLPGLRRTIESVAAISIATAPLTVPAAALAYESDPVVATEKAEPYVPTLAGDPDTYEPSPAGDEPAASDVLTHEVVAGESLWSIAEDAVPRSLPHRDAAVDSYWRVLIELNADSLRSQDPNLIFPGEVLQLPAPPGPGRE